MYKNYTFPLQIFLILEKTQTNIYFSKKNYSNSYNVFLNKNYYLPFFYILKNELFLGSSSLIENSAVDLNYYSNLDNYFLNFYKNNSKMVFFNFNLLNIKCKIYLFLINKNLVKIMSLDKIYPNSSWVERETSEMYGIFFKNKKDHRKLMLDYSSFENPLLKNFPLEGNKQVFFSFFENQVVVQNNKYIEL